MEWFRAYRSKLIINITPKNPQWSYLLDTISINFPLRVHDAGNINFRPSGDFHYCYCDMGSMTNIIFPILNRTHEATGRETGPTSRFPCFFLQLDNLRMRKVDTAIDDRYPDSIVCVSPVRVQKTFRSF